MSVSLFDLTLYHWIQLGITGYVAFINTASFVLMLIGYFALQKRSEAFNPKEIDVLLKSPLLPSVSVLAPAYNEAATIRHSVRSMLRLRHPKHEVIVINDGSVDHTLTELIDEFHLYRSSRVPLGSIQTGTVRGVYESRDPIPLVVIDKENKGKADALNCGINYSRNDLFAAIDADSIVETDALLQISRPFLENPEETMAAGGIIRVANGCTVEHGAVVSVSAPKNLLARLQIVEYLRAFLAARVAMSCANTLLIISGAFGVFRRSVVAEMGGYRLDTVGEDMELVVRLHRYRRERNLPCRVVFLADSVCWTEVPESKKVLRRQRLRWQRGCFESVLFHKRMLGNWRFGSVGLIGMPYFAACEILGPFVELSGYVATVTGLCLGWVSAGSALLFFAVSVLFGLLMSVSSIILEEMTICRYPDPRDLLRLLLAAALENLGYRQITLLWRVQAILQVLLKKKHSWGEMERHGFKTEVALDPKAETI
jgi:cellulose synthase/poly-beta-1,6-N-acetylglucosamine synthase-like glycosyltransferase